MDIKDFILIGGGLLIAAVVVHGFWIAWKARRDPLRMDLVANLPDADDEDDLKRLRAELPNGGARVVGQTDEPRQGDLELDRAARFGDRHRRSGADAPMLLDPAGPDRSARRPAPHSRKTEPRLDPAPAAGAGLEPDGEVPQQAAAEPASPPAAPPPVKAATRTPERAPLRPKPASGPRRDKVKDVALPERGRSGERARNAGAEPRTDGHRAEQKVEELIVVNVLAPKGKPFVGGGMVEALRARGLRYGEMNIFHRLDPMTRTSLYSVASVVEPGTFDLSDLDSFRSPGVCFFMQLPGPEQPLEVFEDMLKAAREVAVRVGGEVKDEQRSVMTGQTVEHYRQRISEFCRRRMSMRA